MSGDRLEPLTTCSDWARTSCCPKSLFESVRIHGIEPATPCSKSRLFRILHWLSKSALTSSNGAAGPLQLVVTCHEYALFSGGKRGRIRTLGPLAGSNRDVYLLGHVVSSPAGSSSCPDPGSSTGRVAARCRPQRAAAWQPKPDPTAVAPGRTLRRYAMAGLISSRTPAATFAAARSNCARPNRTGAHTRPSDTPQEFDNAMPCRSATPDGYSPPRPPWMAYDAGVRRRRLRCPDPATAPLRSRRREPASGPSPPTPNATVPSQRP